eukprot:CAMPEP_0168354362 /NCGR_PEP_ID=MMETSP0213-20121227/23854_1 /TAXON_ID=151035 /ORGANISM="Euplotes harpa, Strain FSP1.4" /LENGTH=98 /DNA_ID=CAMNT_0008366255 /DNA_START=419 /DNA_END=715 /DNA_ORIENTATION=+
MKSEPRGIPFGDKSVTKQKSNFFRLKPFQLSPVDKDPREIKLQDEAMISGFLKEIEQQQFKKKPKVSPADEGQAQEGEHQEVQKVDNSRYSEFTDEDV